MSEQAKDRISDLPDSLIQYILSLALLDIKEVARTSVLSKRWYYIWISTPTLDLRSLTNPPNLWESIKFMETVDRILHLHDMSTIKKFSLHWCERGSLSESRVNLWISAAIRRNVEELSLNLCIHPIFFTPLSLCTCESLVTLELDIFPYFYLPKYMSFPKLKHFKLSGAKFSDKYNSEQLFSSCPVLENLTLESCEWSDIKSICLSTPLLKVLIIRGLNSFYNDGLRICTFEIHAPSLGSLIYEGDVAKEFVMSNVRTLAEVDVDFGFEEYDTSTKGRISHCDRLSKFLQALSHVKCLSISDRTIQVLSPSHNLKNSLPTFHNLKKLNVDHNATSYKPLLALLQSAPNLECVVFSKVRPETDVYYAEGDDGIERYPNTDDWGLDFISTRCSFLHLKSVCFEEFYYHPSEDRWVELILEQATALETMTFHLSYPKAEDDIENIMEWLKSLPRASASCVFNVS